MKNSPIGIFDSGVGGLSILREIRTVLPRENFIFFADQANVPYGEKTKSQLIFLTSRIVQFLSGQKVKMVVVACNTATCYSLGNLRELFFPLPIVGVVPAIKPAAEKTKTKHIALIATPATAKSDYVTELITKYASGINVLKIGCYDLENMVETGQLNSRGTSELLNRYILPLKEVNIDHVVLGCTHYPFLKERISAILGLKVTLIDSGSAVAKRVENILKTKDIVGFTRRPFIKFYTNKDTDKFSKVATKLLGYPVKAEYAPI